MLCHLTVVIVYSSIMIGICSDLPSSDKSLEPVKHVVVQPITGMNGGCHDLRSGNPLVAVNGG
jgi:hypothetical protein